MKTEGNMTELLDEKLLEGENLTVELLLNEKLNELISEKMPKKSIEELKQDEEMLSSFLNNLKKENFQLEITVNAWKTTLRNKLEEFKEADLKLGEIHNEIQSEREEFCSKLDLFNDKYGVLSDWWKKHMNFLPEVENPEEKNSQQENCKEIKRLKKDIEEIKKEIGALKTEKQVEVEVYLAGEPSIESNDISPGRQNTKRVVEENVIVNEGKECEFSENFYSLVDVEKVRMASRRRNQRRAFFQNTQL